MQSNKLPKPPQARRMSIVPNSMLAGNANVVKKYKIVSKDPNSTIAVNILAKDGNTVNIDNIANIVNRPHTVAQPIMANAIPNKGAGISIKQPVATNISGNPLGVHSIGRRTSDASKNMQVVLNGPTMNRKVCQKIQAPDTNKTPMITDAAKSSSNTLNFRLKSKKIEGGILNQSIVQIDKANDNLNNKEPSNSLKSVAKTEFCFVPKPLFPKGIPAGKLVRGSPKKLMGVKFPLGSSPACPSNIKVAPKPLLWKGSPLQGQIGKQSKLSLGASAKNVLIQKTKTAPNIIKRDAKVLNGNIVNAFGGRPMLPRPPGIPDHIQAKLDLMEPPRKRQNVNMRVQPSTKVQNPIIKPTLIKKNLLPVIKSGITDGMSQSLSEVEEDTCASEVKMEVEILDEDRLEYISAGKKIIDLTSEDEDNEKQLIDMEYKIYNTAGCEIDEISHNPSASVALNDKEFPEVSKEDVSKKIDSAFKNFTDNEELKVAQKCSNIQNSLKITPNVNINLFEDTPSIDDSNPNIFEAAQEVIKKSEEVLKQVVCEKQPQKCSNIQNSLKITPNVNINLFEDTPSIDDSNPNIFEAAQEVIKKNEEVLKQVVCEKQPQKILPKSSSDDVILTDKSVADCTTLHENHLQDKKEECFDNISTLNKDREKRILAINVTVNPTEKLRHTILSDSVVISNQNLLMVPSLRILSPNAVLQIKNKKISGSATNKIKLWRSHSCEKRSPISKSNVSVKLRNKIFKLHQKSNKITRSHSMDAAIGSLSIKPGSAKGWNTRHILEASDEETRMNPKYLTMTTTHDKTKNCTYSQLDNFLSTLPKYEKKDAFIYFDWSQGFARLGCNNLLFQINEFNCIELVSHNLRNKYPKYAKKSINKLDFKERFYLNKPVMKCLVCHKSGETVTFYMPYYCSAECVAVRDHDENVMQSLFLVENPSETAYNPREMEMIQIDCPEANNKFSWKTYGKLVPFIPAKLELFNINEADNLFEIGMKLEAVDPTNQSLFCVCTVADTRGQRLRLHFDGYSYFHDFWVNCNSPFIFPVGFCYRTGRTLQVPFGYKKRDFEWETYLKTTQSEMAPLSLFETNLPKKYTNTFSIGMCLEAFDFRHSRKLGVASIIDIIRNYLLIHFDSLSGMLDYWVDVTSPYIQPINFHVRKNIGINFPREWKYSTPFNWKIYLMHFERIAAPPSCFLHRKPIPFVVDTKVEVVDQVFPQLVRPATIIRVCGFEIDVLCDGFPAEQSFRLPDNSPDVHPVTYCASTRHPLEPPSNYGRVVKNKCGSRICRGKGYYTDPQVEHYVNNYRENHSTCVSCPYDIKNFTKIMKFDINRQKRIIPKFQLFPQIPYVNNESHSPENSKIRKIVMLPTSEECIDHKLATERSEDVIIEQEEEVGQQNVTLKANTSVIEIDMDDTHDTKSFSKEDTTQLENIDSIPNTGDTDLDKRLSASWSILNDYASSAKYLHGLWDKHSSRLEVISLSAIDDNPWEWLPDQVADFISHIPGCHNEGEIFRSAQVDGESLMTMREIDLQNLNIGLGNSVKIFNQIVRLREEFISRFSEELVI